MFKYLSVVALTTVSVLAILPLGSPFLLAQAGNNNNNNRLAMMSAYQVSSFKIGEKVFRQAAFIGVLKDEGGQGILMLDPNTCSLNEFGDAQASTFLAQDHHKVELRRVGTADPNKLRRYRYSITGEGVPKSLFLVVATGEEIAGYRLVVGTEKGGASAVITLEPYSEKTVRLLFQNPIPKPPQ